MTEVTKIKGLLANTVDRAFPVPFPFSFNVNVCTYMKKNDLTMNTGSITAWAMYGAYFALKVGTDDGQKPVATIEDGKAVIDLGTEWSEDWSQKLITKQQFNLASNLSANSYARATQYLFDLVGASQSGMLDDKNVESYFASTGIELNVSFIQKLLPAFAASVTMLKDIPEFQTRILNHEWLKYHTSFSSGSGLVLRVLESTGTSEHNVGPFNISPAIVASVISATKEPWNKVASDAIPMNLKGVCHVYLEALGMLPSAKWYQGEKGRSMLSPATISAIRAYAVKTIALKSDTKSIESSTDVMAADAALVKAGVLPSFI